jgi:hypothetical protein
MKVSNHSTAIETVSTVEAVREAFADYRATRTKNIDGRNHLYIRAFEPGFAGHRPGRHYHLGL